MLLYDLTRYWGWILIISIFLYIIIVRLTLFYLLPLYLYIFDCWNKGSPTEVGKVGARTT